MHYFAYGFLLLAAGASFGYPTGIKATGRISLGALMTFLTSSSLNAPIQHEPKPNEQAVNRMF